jgi:hypothetical protein
VSEPTEADTAETERLSVIVKESEPVARLAAAPSTDRGAWTRPSRARACLKNARTHARTAHAHVRTHATMYMRTRAQAQVQSHAHAHARTCLCAHRHRHTRGTDGHRALWRDHGVDDGPTDGRVNGRTDGRTDELMTMDTWINGRTEGRMDK